jgi:hypothetical protein
MFKKLGIDRSCLLALPDRDETIEKSARNLDRTTLTTVKQLNAWDILQNRTLLLTKAGWNRFSRETKHGPELSHHQAACDGKRARTSRRHGIRMRFQVHVGANKHDIKNAHRAAVQTSRLPMCGP